MFTNILCTKT